MKKKGGGKPWSQERIDKFYSGFYGDLREQLSIRTYNACKGVPKSQETKDRMSIAKLGKPKSKEHREHMRETHLKRSALLVTIRKTLPRADRYAVAKEIKELYGCYPEIKDIDHILKAYVSNSYDLEYDEL
jgi:hypothetical protein